MTQQDTYWRNRPVFVTGCTGLVGTWLSQELAARGARVIGLVRDDVFDSRLFGEGIADGMVLVRGCIEDYFLLERTLNEYEIHTVFHLAAQTIVGTANRNPMATFDANIRGTWNLLEAARRNELVKAVVVASSDKAYGPQKNLPYTEDTPLRGTHPYDVSKSCADLISAAYHETYGLPVCITRCGNFFGGGDLNFNRIVPGTIRSAFLGERPIVRSDGKFIRDYIYVRDAVGAYMTLARKMTELPIHGQAFNFSNGLQMTVLELVDKILAAAGRPDLEPDILNQASNEIPAQNLASDKARDTLGWKPLFSIEEALDETVAWYRDYLQHTPSDNDN